MVNQKLLDIFKKVIFSISAKKNCDTEKTKVINLN